MEELLLEHKKLKAEKQRLCMYGRQISFSHEEWWWVQQQIRAIDTQIYALYKRITIRKNANGAE